MKSLNSLTALILILLMVFTSCDKKEDDLASDTLPENFKVDVPVSLKSTVAQKNAKAEEMSGDEIYEHLTFFIGVGDEAADLVQEIIRGINVHNLSQSVSFSYVSEDDGRKKNVVILETADYEDETWEYQLSVTDADSENNDDGGYGLQVFWNNNPVKGIAILKPYNIDRSGSENNWSEALFRIDYSEAGEYGYEQSMIVHIAELPTPESDIYAISSMKMFVGKTGDIVDVFGNSAHPNAILYGSDPGFDWAFTASADESNNLAVAEVGLPPYLTDSNNREVLLGEYSILNVFTNLIQTWFLNEHGITIDELTLSAYLENARAPGFFNQDGFIGSGIAPSDEFSALLENIQALTPYNPFKIANMEIAFKKEDLPVK